LTPSNDINGTVLEPVGQKAGLFDMSPNYKKRKLGLCVRNYLDCCRYEAYRIKVTRASYIALLCSLLSIIGLSILICTIYTVRANDLSPYQLITTDPVFLSLSGTFLAQLIIGVFAILSVTNEYGYGTIVTSALLEPIRTRFLLAKLIVVSSVIFLSTALALSVAFLVGEKILSARFQVVSILSLTALKSIAGSALYLTILSCICIGIAVSIRRTSGAVATLFGILLLLPIIVSLLPSPWAGEIGKYLPGSAGVVLAHSFQISNMMSPLKALAVLACYAILWMGLGIYFITHRDI